MKTTITSRLILFITNCLSLALGGQASAATVVDFSDLSPGPSSSTTSYWSGPDPNGTSGLLYSDPATYGQFTSEGAAFQNVYAVDPSYGPYWEGFAYSNVVNTTTPDYTNQFASITGGGVHGAGSTYAVGYYDPYSVTPTVILPAPTTVLSANFTNTTYAYDDMLNGSFGDNPFSSGDSYQLTISGYNQLGDPADGSPITINLATGSDILNTWKNFDLESLGDNVKSMQFSLTSTQPFTPTYFALGDLTVVPEPSSMALAACGGIAALLAWRKRSTKKHILR